MTPNASVVRTSARTAPAPVPLRPLDRLGRRIVRLALARLPAGSVEIIDAWAGAPAPPTAPPTAAPLPPDRAPTPPRPIRLIVEDPAFYSAAALGGSLAFAESYIDARWRTNDLPGLIEIVASQPRAMRSLEGAAARALAPLARLAYCLQRNSRRGSRRNIAAHYDLGDDFFSLFLDESLTYSCAIFENGAETLAQAQQEKIDRACRKLRLTPDDHLLEIGSGWGALAIHAAAQYGCRVTTTTISQRQHAACLRRVHSAGLAGRVRVLHSDYRDLRGSFTKLVSIEMIEAVGAERLGHFLGACSRLLTHDAIALIQAIVINDQAFRAASKRRDFLKKHIFPGSCLPSVTAITESLRDRTDMRVWHLEDIGPHYARTLALWRNAFHARIDDARALGFDDRFIRTWDYYFAYCEGAFRARYCGDVQLLLVKPGARPIPHADPASLLSRPPHAHPRPTHAAPRSHRMVGA